MQNDTETPEVENTPGETENVAAQGTTEASATGSPASEPESTEQTEESTVSREEFERVQKELRKLEMERNQLRNKQEEERKKQLEESNEYKTLYEETQSKLEQIESEKQAEETRKEAERLRQSFIEEYPDERVRKAAQALIKQNPTNIAWGDVETEEQAKAEVHQQMDALKETLGITGEEEETDYPEINPNNPQTPSGNDPVSALDWKKMREVLPKADPR